MQNTQLDRSAAASPDANISTHKVFLDDPTQIYCITEPSCVKQDATIGIGTLQVVGVYTSLKTANSAALVYAMEHMHARAVKEDPKASAKVIHDGSRAVWTVDWSARRTIIVVHTTKLSSTVCEAMMTVPIGLDK
ncbi:hypothetical protein PMZ80_008587 [Knufia obscura]|uniref:Uncharacterized protein n=2 Tax=Knufia TaxID=430999 RepID=A0AAN8ILA7_9EURO|nr:hypothetical protein PMZ80_008587 [Knufia obscura]KAK5952042.1 hypothetical protein OHC33_006929 [Knufia fluminis]